MEFVRRSAVEDLHRLAAGHEGVQFSRINHRGVVMRLHQFAKCLARHVNSGKEAESCLRTGLIAACEQSNVAVAQRHTPGPGAFGHAVTGGTGQDQKYFPTWHQSRKLHFQVSQRQ
ncbi:hypothetical protein D3C71_1652760 [compost metagenome]